MKQHLYNITVEQFNEEYPNRGKLEIFLPTPGSPTKELKSVKDFTNDEKVAYMTDILYLRQYNRVRKAKAQLLDPMDDDFQIPSSIGEAYLASLQA